MSRNVLLVCLCLVALSACSPAGSPETIPPSTTPTPRSTSPPTLPRAQGTTETIIPSPTPEETSQTTLTSAPTLSEWETIRQQIARLRNLLDRDSDGYAGLTAALEQDSPNAAWCAGIGAAIGDFNYVGDSESAQALEMLMDAQGCP